MYIQYIYRRYSLYTLRAICIATFLTGEKRKKKKKKVDLIEYKTLLCRSILVYINRVGSPRLEGN